MASTTAAEFLDFATRMRSEIDAALARYIDYEDRCPPRLAEAIRYSLLAPGKRLRPVLVLLAAEACGCESAVALPAACAVEMVHAYSLIHDDLPAMDDDDLRRGRPTCHVQFDEATAILAGDALLTQAFETLAIAKWPASVTVRCCKELAQAAGTAGMVGGQADDLAAEERDDGDLDDLQSIHRRKTGAMIRVSLRLGAIVGQATSEQLNAVTAYGEKLGLAFQIVDDLLDFRGDVQTLGKRTQKDAGLGKLTFPGLLGVEEASARAESLIAAACDDVAMFGPKASRLESLARYVMERNH
jgi:geranylgeranyl diphosphate synthase type II